MGGTDFPAAFRNLKLEGHILYNCPHKGLIGAQIQMVNGHDRIRLDLCSRNYVFVMQSGRVHAPMGNTNTVRCRL